MNEINQLKNLTDDKNNGNRHQQAETLEEVEGYVENAKDRKR
ncbi:hypothetical protein [Dolosigranulum pigrum]|nr:hypothetical protein [Dolosigranulum pigrum]